MRNFRLLSVVMGTAACCACFTSAHAQLTDYTWTGGSGTVAWQSSNWSQVGEVDASTYPDDAFHSANISGPLAGSMTMNIDGSDPNRAFVEVGGITMGGTGSAVTTNIASVNGGYLLLRNNDDVDFQGDREVNGLDFLAWQRGYVEFSGVENPDIGNGDGDWNGDNIVDGIDLARWEELYGSAIKYGNARITSGGAPGSTNIFTAPVWVGGENVELTEQSTNDLTFAGDIRAAGNITLNNFSNKTMFVTGAVNTLDATDGTTRRRLILNSNDSNTGFIHFTSTSSITGEGDPNGGQHVIIGGLGGFTGELFSVQIDSANPNLKGVITFNKGNIILGHDLAIGTPGETSLDLAGNTGRLGFNIHSTDDARNMAHDLDLGQPVTFMGEHSLTWSGRIEQSNSRRGIINLLPAGKTLNLTGRIGANNGDGTGENPDNQREFPFDGSGETLVTGGFHDDDIDHNGIPNDGGDDPNDPGPTTRAGLYKKGSGTVRVSGTTSTFRGRLTIEQGNLIFDRFDHLTAMANATGFGEMRSRGGAVGLATGSYDNASFRALFSNSGTTMDTGGVMLAPSEAAAALNFSTTHASMRFTTIAAPPEGITFTGTITPQGTDATFRLGGGTGTLTMAASKVNGTGRKLYIANGGVVKLTGGSNVATTAGTSVEITAKYVRTRENVAATGYDGRLVDNDIPRNEIIYLGTTLEVDTLANAGVNSGVGAGSTADQLLIRGSTLRYVGAATSTNRLFTVGTGGATIDASGSGAVDFTSTSALAMEEAAPRISTNDSSTVASNVLSGIPSTANLTIGMTVTGLVGGTLFTPGTPSTIPANTTIVDILSPTSVRLSNNLPVGSWTEGGTVTFSNFARTLSLTGTNTGNNFMRPLIGNATQGNVGITKSGTGKWVLTNANTYSGPTAVNAGTLLINGNQSGGSAYTVAAGATLGGSGTLGGVGASLVSSGTVAPGDGIGALTVGGAYTQNSGGSLAVEIAGGASFDTLVVNGAASLSGTINVDLQSFSPAIGQQFNIVTASGGLTTSGLTVTGDGNWTASVVSGNTLRLTFVSALQAIPEPSTLVLVSLGMLCAGRRRRD